MTWTVGTNADRPGFSIKDEHGGYVGYTQTEKQARLIAAAPDLLETLQHVEESIRYAINRVTDAPELALADLSAAQTLALRAIAKAVQA